ncbi:MAG: MFS transporter [Deltaproteobacteria bacterium]|nr:MFS transporter [Deltaproteobacteria bacterium]
MTTHAESPSLVTRAAVTPPAAPKFSRYEAFVVAILAFLQFTIILDFMILSPLGAMLLRDLHISTQQFGLVVSVYAFSAGASGLLAAGFADRFDRKRFLLFFYGGFLLGTLFCGLAPNYHRLVLARMLTGVFGGVIGSVSFAIIADMFPFQMRGRVMGYVQTAFAGSQILGIPLGLYLSNKWGWHMPFLLILAVGLVVGVVIIIGLKPINAHLNENEHNPFVHLWNTITTRRHLRAFATTGLLVTGGFMLMPFGSAFSVHNQGISMEQLPAVYMVTGVVAMLTGPFVGRLSDRIGKFWMFCIGSTISITIVCIYCNLGLTPLWLVILLNGILFIGISSRMISAQALMSAVPAPQNRGSFMSVNSSVQQISGGIASYAAGLIVVQTASGKLLHYNILGYVVSGAMVAAMLLLYGIHKMVMADAAPARAA